MGEKKKLSFKEIGIKRLSIMLVCGVVLLVLTISGDDKVSEPVMEESAKNLGDGKTNMTQKELSERMEEYVDNMEKRMEKQLAIVDGVGDVKVMITLKSSAEKVVLKDEMSTGEIIDEKDAQGGSRNNESTSKENESVLVDSGEGSAPFTIKETAPYIQGVVVVAQGGDNAKVKQEIIDAVWVLFDVEVHKIKVMKMSSD